MSMFQWYKDPHNSHPITSLSFICVDVKIPITATEQKIIKRLFISYKYETGIFPPNHKPTTDRHQPAMCPITHNNIPCTAYGFPRNKVTKGHICLLSEKEHNQPPGITKFFRPLDQSDSIRRVRSTGRETPVQKYILGQIVRLLSSTPTSFSFASSDAFYEFLVKLIKVGQDNPASELTTIAPTVTPPKLSFLMSEKASELTGKLISCFSDQHISVMFDAATINHRKYLGVTIQALNDLDSPFFFQLVEGPLSAPDYSQFVEEMISVLGKASIEVAGIVTDGLSAQISGIDNCITKLKGNPTSADTLTFLPFRMPCFNHRLNLVIVHCFKNIPMLDGTKQKMMAFSESVKKKSVHDVLKKYCPIFIHSRWLCLSQICAYIRMKRDVILQHNYLKREHIERIMMVEAVILPILELHLFFETERTRLYQAFPALIRCLLQYKYLLSLEIFRRKPWIYIITEFIRVFYALCLSDKTGDRLAIAFVLSPVGRYLYKTRQFVSGYRLDAPLATTINSLFVPFLYHLNLSFRKKDISAGIPPSILVSKYFVQLTELEVRLSGGLGEEQPATASPGALRSAASTSHPAILPITHQSIASTTPKISTPQPITLPTASHPAILPITHQSIASPRSPLPLFPSFPTFPATPLQPPESSHTAELVPIPFTAIPDSNIHKPRYFSAPYFSQVQIVRQTNSTFSLSALRASRKRDTTNPPSIMPTTISMIIPPKETARLALHSLTSILSTYITATTEEAPVIQIDDESEDDFGILDAEQKARNDEYEDRNRMEPTERRVTRSQSRRTETHQFAILRRRRSSLAAKTEQLPKPVEPTYPHNLLSQSPPKKSTIMYGINKSLSTSENTRDNQRVSHTGPKLKIPGEHAVVSHLPPISLTRSMRLHRRTLPKPDISDVSSVSLTEDEDRISLLQSREINTHLPYTNDETEFGLINRIVRALIGEWEQRLESAFQEFASDILPEVLKSSVDPLTQQFRHNLYSTNIEKVLLNINADLEASTHAGTYGKQFAAAARLLLFAPCSEASCERLFSLTKFICGKRRYNLKLSSLNGCLMLAQEQEIEDLYASLFSDRK